jgi:hypothetical protein
MPTAGAPKALVAEPKPNPKQEVANLNAWRYQTPSPVNQLTNDDTS